MSLIARLGDPIEVAPGDERTPVKLGVSLGGAGLRLTHRGSVSDRDEVVFEAHFGDGSQGIFLACLSPQLGCGPLPVPEPAASEPIALACCLVLAALRSITRNAGAAGEPRCSRASVARPTP